MTPLKSATATAIGAPTMLDPAAPTGSASADAASAFSAMFADLVPVATTGAARTESLAVPAGEEAGAEPAGPAQSDVAPPSAAPDDAGRCAPLLTTAAALGTTTPDAAMRADASVPVAPVPQGIAVQDVGDPDAAVPADRPAVADAEPTGPSSSVDCANTAELPAASVAPPGEAMIAPAAVPILPDESLPKVVPEDREGDAKPAIDAPAEPIVSRAVDAMPTAVASAVNAPVAAPVHGSRHATPRTAAVVAPKASSPQPAAAPDDGPTDASPACVDAPALQSVDPAIAGPIAATPATVPARATRGTMLATSPARRGVTPACAEDAPPSDAASAPTRRHAAAEDASTSPAAPLVPPPVAVVPDTSASPPAAGKAAVGAAVGQSPTVAPASVAPTSLADDASAETAPALTALIAAAGQRSERQPAWPAASPSAAAPIGAPDVSSPTVAMLAARSGLGIAAVLPVRPTEIPATPIATVTIAPIDPAPVAAASPATAAQPSPLVQAGPVPAPATSAPSPAGRETTGAAPARAPRSRSADRVRVPDAGGVTASSSAPVESPVTAVPTASATLAAAGADRQLEQARHAAWADGIARDIASAGASSGTARFTVAPATLGQVSVEISRSAEGAAVRLVASSDAARDALDAARPQLVAEARGQGLRLHDVSVDLGGSSGGSGSGAHRDTESPQPTTFIADQPRQTAGTDTNSLTTGAYGGASGGEAGRQAQQHARQPATPPQTARTAATRPSTVPQTGGDAARRTADGRYA